MIYADYSFYKQNFFGTLVGENDFEAAAAKASAFLDYYTMGKAKDNAENNALKMACCAVAEQCYIERMAIESSAESAKSGGAKVSETVGSYSVSYSTAADAAGLVSNARAGMAKAAQLYLAGTGMLYRGGCRYVCTAHRNCL